MGSWGGGASAICLFPDGAATRYADYGSQDKLGTEAPIEFAVDRNLLAGLEIMVGSYVLRANLRDELEYFSAMRNHE